MFVLEAVRLPADQRGAREARQRDPREHRGRPSSSARRPTSCSTSTAQRLKEAREQADDIVARARKAAEAAEAEATDEGKAKREELVAAARKDIEAETRRSLEQIRKEVADLTVLATEKVTRKSLDDDDQKRLVEEALAEVDFSALSGAEANGGGRALDGGDRPRIRASPVRRRQGDGQARRDPRAARRVRRRAWPRTATCRSSSSAPTSPRPRSATGSSKAVVGRRARADQLPRAARREAPDAGDLPDPRAASTSLGEGEQAPRGDRDQRRRARPGASSSGSARRSRSRPAGRSS